MQNNNNKFYTFHLNDLKINELQRFFQTNLLINFPKILFKIFLHKRIAEHQKVQKSLQAHC